MILEWVNSISVVRVHLSDRTELEFPAKAWNRSRLKVKVQYDEDSNEEVSPNIFNTINLYFSQQPRDKILKIEQLYRNIYETLEVEDDVTTLNSTLNKLIYDLFCMFEWSSFAMWLIIHGELNLSIGAKDSLGEKDTLEITYFTQDYENLVFFSVLLKTIMPIWGMYHNNMAKVLGKDRVLLSAVDLIRNPYTDENPAFVRLEKYAEDFSADRIKVNGFSIASDISTGEIPDYMLAFALWKKVCIFDGRVQAKSVIRDVHAILKDRCARIETAGPTQKIFENSSGEEISIVDTWKVVQRVPPAIEVIVTHSLHDLPAQLDPDLKLTDINDIRNKIPSNLVIRDFHIPIVAAVCGHIVGNRDLLLVMHEVLLDIIAITAAALAKWEYPALSSILVATPKIKNMYDLSLNNNTSQIPLTADNIIALKALYKYAGDNNPGLKLIENTIRVVNTLAWDIPGIETLTNELARLLLVPKLNRI